MTKTYSNTVKLAQLIEQYSCIRFLKFLLDNYVTFISWLDRCAPSIVLKSFTDEACTMCAGRLFHKLTIWYVIIMCVPGVISNVALDQLHIIPSSTIIGRNCNDGKPSLRRKLQAR